MKPEEIIEKCRDLSSTPSTFDKLTWREVLTDLARGIIKTQAERVKELDAKNKTKNDAIGIVIKCVSKNLSLIDISQMWPNIYKIWDDEARFQPAHNGRADFLCWVLQQALKVE